MKNTALVILLFAVTLLSQFSLAEERHIHVNGQHLSAEEIQLMDQLWGYTVPNAFYWLDLSTGQWGYENSDQVQGVLQAVVQYNQQQQQSGGTSYGGTEINQSQNGSVVSGTVNGQNCTYASAGGMTIKSCD